MIWRNYTVRYENKGGFHDAELRYQDIRAVSMAHAIRKADKLRRRGEHVSSIEVES